MKRDDILLNSFNEEQEDETIDNEHDMPDSLAHIFSSQESYNDAVKKAGSAEKVHDLYRNYDASKPFYSNLYTQTHNKPRTIANRDANRAKTIASIADAVGLLTNAISLSKKGNVVDNNTSAIQNTNNELNRLQNIYDARKSQYENGLYNAMLQDIQRQRNDRMLDYNMKKYRDLQDYRDKEAKRKEKNDLLNAIQKEKQIKIQERKNELDAKYRNDLLEMKAKERKDRNEYRSKKLSLEEEYKKAQIVKMNDKENEAITFYKPDTHEYIDIPKNKYRALFSQKLIPIVLKNKHMNIIEKQEFDKLSESSKQQYVIAELFNNKHKIRDYQEAINELTMLSDDEQEKESQNQIQSIVDSFSEKTINDLKNFKIEYEDSTKEEQYTRLAQILKNAGLTKKEARKIGQSIIK